MSNIDTINSFVEQQQWFEFSMFSYSKRKLEIIGSDDLSYYFDLKIIFNGVFQLSTFSEWHSRDGVKCIRMLEGDELKEYSIRWKIEQKHNIYEFAAEDGLSFYITAKDISVEVERVYFSDLRANQHSSGGI